MLSPPPTPLVQIFGDTVHPLDQSRTPGGSSGGEAALVIGAVVERSNPFFKKNPHFVALQICGGGSLVGIGSDLGGSVRTPAALCGICAIKPTAGRIPLAGQAIDGGLQGVVGPK